MAIVRLVLDGRTRVKVLREKELEEALVWWVCTTCGMCYAKPLKRGCFCTSDGDVDFFRHNNGTLKATPLVQVGVGLRPTVEAAWCMGGKAAVLVLLRASASSTP